VLATTDCWWRIVVFSPGRAPLYVRCSQSPDVSDESLYVVPGIADKVDDQIEPLSRTTVSAGVPSGPALARGPYLDSCSGFRREGTPPDLIHRIRALLAVTVAAPC
jgi:hypothetical protein